MLKNRKLIVKTTLALGVFYLLICAIFYGIQTKILFKPPALEQGHIYSYTFDFNERFFEMEDGVKIHAIHAKTADSSKGLVLFLHGNASNNNTNPIEFTTFMKEGYDVLYPDYRGYGLSSGSLRNEVDLVGDMNNVYQQITSEYKEQNIHLIGFSIGSGVAAQIAAQNNPKSVMLWNPYYSIVDVMKSSYPFLPTILLKFPLRTNLSLPNISAPVTIFYSENDEVLPIKRSIKLNELLNEEDNFYILEGQGHNGLFFNNELLDKLPILLK